MATPDLQPTEQGQGLNLQPHEHYVGFLIHWAMTWTLRPSFKHRDGEKAPNLPADSSGAQLKENLPVHNPALPHTMNVPGKNPLWKFPFQLSSNEPNLYPWGCGFDPWSQSVGESIPRCCMLWYRLTAAALIWLIVWELPCATGVALKREGWRIPPRRRSLTRNQAPYTASLLDSLTCWINFSPVDMSIAS